MNKPTLYIIAGCNGAGKTTAPIVDIWSLYDNSDGISPIVNNSVIVNQSLLKQIEESCQKKKDWNLEIE